MRLKRDKAKEIGDKVLTFIEENYPTLTKDNTRKVFSNLYRRLWTPPAIRNENQGK